HQKLFDRALERLYESRRLFESLGHRQGMALTAIHISLNLLERGAPDEALPHAQEGLRTGQEIGDRHCEMYALDALGCIASKQGQAAEAREQFRRSFAIAQAVGEQRHIAEVLFHYGEMLSRHDAAKDAYLLLAVAGREFAALGVAEVAEAAAKCEAL